MKTQTWGCMLCLLCLPRQIEAGCPAKLRKIYTLHHPRHCWHQTISMHCLNSICLCPYILSLGSFLNGRNCMEEHLYAFTRDLPGVALVRNHFYHARWFFRQTATNCNATSFIKLSQPATSKLWTAFLGHWEDASSWKVRQITRHVISFNRRLTLFHLWTRQKVRYKQSGRPKMAKTASLTLLSSFSHHRAIVPNFLARP